MQRKGLLVRQAPSWHATSPDHWLFLTTCAVQAPPPNSDPTAAKPPDVPDQGPGSGNNTKSVRLVAPGKQMGAVIGLKGATIRWVCGHLGFGRVGLRDWAGWAWSCD